MLHNSKTDCDKYRMKLYEDINVYVSLKNNAKPKQKQIT